MQFRKLIPLALVISLGVLALSVAPVFSHCQIPCGIYDDEARFKLMAEHISTLEKSMTRIRELSAAENKDHNQIVRWVDNKDTHADELGQIVTYYFLAQRVKPVADGGEDRERYVVQLTTLHGMLVHAMKAKQTTDLQHVAKLRELLAEFKKAYAGKS